MIVLTLALLAYLPAELTPELPPAPPAPTYTAAARVAPSADGSAELILIGDTGEPGPLVTRWQVALKNERARTAIVLGDLLYPQAPPCPTGVPNPAALAMFETNVHAPFAATGKEVFLLLGNHDMSWVDDEPPRDLCVIRRFEKDPQVRLPAAWYAVDMGVAALVVLNTNKLDDEQARFAKAIIAAHPGKRVIFAGHHVLRTFHDKVDEDIIEPWLVQHGLRPDMWVNGHAHVLQLVMRDGIPAVTSGTASRPRERPACDRAANTGSCGEGQLWGSSTPGYAVLRVGPASEQQRLSLVFKDVDGKDLWAWQEAWVKAPPAPAPKTVP